MELRARVDETNGYLGKSADPQVSIRVALAVPKSNLHACRGMLEEPNRQPIYKANARVIKIGISVDVQHSDFCVGSTCFPCIHRCIQRYAPEC